MPDQPTRPAPPKKSVASEERGAIPAPTPTVLAGRRRLLVGGIAAGPVLFAASTRSALAVECRSPSQVFSGNISQEGPSTCDTGYSPEAWKVFATLPWPGTMDPPTIELRTGETWDPTGTGAEPLEWFTGALAPNANPPVNNPPLARIKGPYCDSSPGFGAPYEFGTLFADLPGIKHASALTAVVPTMKRQGPTCSSVSNQGRRVSLWEVLAYPDEVSDSLGEFASCIVAAYLNSLRFARYAVTTGQIIHMWNDSFADGYYCPTSGCTGWSMDRTIQYLESTWGAAPPVS